MKTVIDKIFLLFLAIVLVIFGTWIYIAPKEAVSERENRALANFPKVSIDSITNGRFSEGISAFYRDRFPTREKLMSIKCKIEILCGRKENNGVVVCDNGYLCIRPEYSDLDTYLENLSQIESFCNSSTVDTAVFFAPRSVDVLTHLLPSGYPTERDNILFDIAQGRGLEVITANESISSAAARGEYVWFKTDHHWTSGGAYIAYKSICERFDIAPLGADELYIESVEGDFYGTVASRFAAEAPASDAVKLMRYDKDGELFVIDYDTREVSYGFYRYEHADIKDKYSVFLGGNHGHIGVYREGEERARVMVIKDSFANSVIPFLASHYDLEVYDLRYFKGKLSEEIENNSPDKILILYGIDTVATDVSLKYLNR